MMIIMNVMMIDITSVQQGLVKDLKTSLCGHLNE